MIVSTSFCSPSPIGTIKKDYTCMNKMITHKVEHCKDLLKCWKMSNSSSNTIARKFVTKYLSRKCSHRLYMMQEIFVIFSICLALGMSYNLLTLYKSVWQVEIVEIEVYHIMRHHTFSEIYTSRKFIFHLHRKFLFLDFPARKRNLFSRPGVY
jgi:hypothetical protein